MVPKTMRQTHTHTLKECVKKPQCVVDQSEIREKKNTQTCPSLNVDSNILFVSGGKPLNNLSI